MEEEMEVEVYEVVEVDLDYEFDAARYFDFTRPESESEARLSESWFESAPSYPPSPFVAKLFQREDLYSENVNDSPKSNYDNSLSLVDGDTDIIQNIDHAEQDEAHGDNEGASQALLHNVKSGQLPIARNQVEGLHGGFSKGFSFYNHFADNMKKTKTSFLTKPSLPRKSTLMKHTVSQLAKQNSRYQVSESRSQKKESSLSAHLGIERQASKRQKLDGGYLRKIVDMKQPINLIRKVPIKDGVVKDMISQMKLRITIPREPDLETAHRAEKTRSTSIKEVENATATTTRFKARPLNRKIFEAPVRPITKKSTPHLPDFQAFHLKTTGRAKQHASTASSTMLCHTEKGISEVSTNAIQEAGNKESRRYDSADAPNMAVRQPVHTFKARPLDRKILTSKGDIGVFRNNKRDVTIPKEFEFQTAKRNQQNPPIELFSKLSLGGKPQPKSCTPLGFPQRTSIHSKASKENRWESCYQDQNIKHQAKEKQDTHSGKHIQSAASGRTGEIGLLMGMSRTLGIMRH